MERIRLIVDFLTGFSERDSEHYYTETAFRRRIFLSSTFILSVVYMYSVFLFYLLPDLFQLNGTQIMLVGSPIIIMYVIALKQFHTALEWLLPIYINVLLIILFLIIDLNSFQLLYLLVPILIIIVLHGNLIGVIGLIINLIIVFVMANFDPSLSLTSLFSNEIFAISVISSFVLVMNYYKNSAQSSTLEIIERQNKQIIENQKMDVIQQLSGSVAHDFNNTLMVISGYVELLDLKENSTNEASSIEIKEIKNAIEKAKIQISQFQSMSKKKNAIMETIDLAIYLQHFMQIVNTIVHPSISVSLDIKEKELFVEIDRTNLQQILINLILNAQDALRSDLNSIANTIIIQVKSLDFHPEYVDANRQWILLKVIDDGPGMDIHTRNKIFDPFFTTKVEGTGLGLVIVKELVEEIHGSIYVESQIGEGTQINLLFPKADQDTKTQTISTPQTKFNINELSNKCILLVDDDEFILGTISRYLKHFKICHHLAKDADSALNIYHNLGKEHCDIVIADILMPGKTGIELFDDISKLNGEQPFLFMSGYNQDPHLDDILIQSYVDYIAKPFVMDALLEKIYELSM